ncbi:hypothetical protein Bhyg_16815 [Pseudolycoriella hygida]|uniref:Uncharacterized protein n=1 Tax=Pseudolycoriella hygida TaxID=35572 RepID=A0A9Q0ML63_9DIPT|nr:hypothetical protein Bhyg_16815 [Pseudolycoriella hygida]
MTGHSKCRIAVKQTNYLQNMKNFILILLLSTVCAYPLNENEENGQENVPMESYVNEQIDDQLAENTEETKDMTDNDAQPEVHPEALAPLFQPEEVSHLVQQALDLNRNIQTSLNIENWNGGTVNSGLSIGTAYFISDVHCTGAQCSVKLT